jgi:hypothetical protein
MTMRWKVEDVLYRGKPTGDSVYVSECKRFSIRTHTFGEVRFFSLYVDGAVLKGSPNYTNLQEALDEAARVRGEV